MASADCISQVIKAAKAMGRDLADDEVQAIFERLEHFKGDPARASAQLVTDAQAHADSVAQAIVDAAQGQGLKLSAAKTPRSELLADIAALGGISDREMSDIIGENKQRATKGMPPRLFKSRDEGGRELDDLAISLRERGWDLPEDNDIDALTNLIQGELSGKRAQRMGEEGKTEGEQTEQSAESISRKYNDLEEAAAEKHGFDPGNPTYKAEIRALRTAKDLEIAQVLADNGDRTGSAARRYVAENQDTTIEVTDEQGNVNKMTLQEYVDRAQAEADALRAQKDVYDIAAECWAGMQ